MQSSHVNEIELAQLMPSFEKVNKPKSSGLNHGAGRAFSPPKSACSLLASWSSVMALVFLVLQPSSGAAALKDFCCFNPPTHPLPPYAPFARGVFLRLKPISRESSTHAPGLCHLLWTSCRTLGYGTRAWSLSQGQSTAWLCGGPRLCSLIYSFFLLGSHQTAANSWRDQWRLQRKGPNQGPIWFWFPFACHCATPSMRWA